jgi:hypothetical protein
MFPHLSLLLSTVKVEDMHNSTDSLNISFVIQQVKDNPTAVTETEQL